MECSDNFLMNSSESKLSVTAETVMRGKKNRIELLSIPLDYIEIKAKSSN